MTTAQWRTLTIGLAVVFLALVGFVVVLLLDRTGDGGVGSTATPTPIATASDGPGAGSGSAEPSTSPTAAASAGGSPSSSPSASATGAVPPTRAVIRGLGVDDPGSPQAKPRIVVFASDGPGDVTVKLQKASGGKVEICLYPGTLAKPLGDPACLKSAGGTLTGHSTSKKAFTWTVTLAGVKGGTTPTADLRIDWPATKPRLEISKVRLQGSGAEPYDRVTVELGSRPQAGELRFAADWNPPDGVNEQPYRATITDRDTGATLEQASGVGTSVELSAEIAAGQRTRVELLNTEPLVAIEVLAALVLTWP